jgi:putative ABC transport system permease protein
MLKNYFTIALRFMIRQKGFSIINISGLTLGIGCSLFILLYLLDELRYDTFHTDANRIYRVVTEGKIQGKETRSIYTGSPLAPTLQKKSSAIESTVRLASWATFPVRYQDRAFTETNLLLADSNFFRFFNYQLIEGNLDSVLHGKRKLIITESAAKRYFDYKGPGDKNPLGKEMTLAQGYTATIAGIAKDPPPNSHFHFPFILSLASWDEALQSGWITSRVVTYFKIRQDASIQTVESDLNKFTTDYIQPALKELRHVDLDQFKKEGNDLRFKLQPLLSIHLNSHLADELENNGNLNYIYLFASIAVFILLLACINFMNLSTARAASRAKEVGVRKAIGAQTSRLVFQFLIESYFYIFIAVVLACCILMIGIGPFNILTQKQLDSSVILSPGFLAGVFVFILVLGLLAGSYPAFYLTQFTPIEVLKGRVRNKLRNYGIRNVLVVFQFLISAGLIIATLTVYMQLRYMQHIGLGFDKRNIVNLLHTANLQTRGVAFKKELLNLKEVEAASYCNRLPPNLDWQYIFRPNDSDKNYLLNVYEMDYDHLKTMKYSIVTGRFFSSDFPGDSSAVILNQTAARKLNITDLHTQKLFTEYGSGQGKPREIIGIMQDFNFQSLRDSIQPMAIVLSRQPNWEMAIRIKEGDPDMTIGKIRFLWKKYSPEAPFEYTFLEKNFNAKLSTEKRIGFLFLLFTTMAIIIACLGLFGLATFTAEQRTKEIGIRKVLGASTNNILRMLNKEFLTLVLIANVIAWPVTGWFMHKWLNQFAYRIDMQWWVFLVAGFITAIIAFASVSSRALRAAKGNPVNSLRNE